MLNYTRLLFIFQNAEWHHAMSSPAVIDILPPVPYALPFIEDWASGDLQTNIWLASASNWSVVSSGFPAPSVRFSSSPQLADYSETLTSRLLDSGEVNNVVLSFALSLSNFGAIAENMLSIEVYISQTDSWTTIQTISTLDGDATGFGFTNFTYNISAYSANQEFRIRFRAHGEDSSEMNFWQIDNIFLGDIPEFLPAPENVSTWISSGGLLVSWDPVPGADWYCIYFSEQPNGTYTKIGTVNFTTVLYPALALSYRKLFIKVTAGAGLQPGIRSNPSIFSTLDK